MISSVPFYPIEVLIVITKHLHISEYPIVKDKWIFTRLKLDRLLKSSDTQKLSVQIQQNIGKRLTQSIVFSGQKQIGKIYFSVTSTWP